MQRRLPDQLTLFGEALSKMCVRCGLEKPIEGFAFRFKARQKRLAHCRSCQAKYSRKHYEVNRSETDILVLEFDHLSDKAFNVSWGVRNSSWAALIAEIEKCEVLCGNCHRRRTAQKAGYWRTRSK